MTHSGIQEGRDPPKVSIAGVGITSQETVSSWWLWDKNLLLVQREYLFSQMESCLQMAAAERNADTFSSSPLKLMLSSGCPSFLAREQGFQCTLEEQRA